MPVKCSRLPPTADERSWKTIEGRRRSKPTNSSSAEDDLHVELSESSQETANYYKPFSEDQRQILLDRTAQRSYSKQDESSSYPYSDTLIRSTYETTLRLLRLQTQNNGLASVSPITLRSINELT